MSVRRFLILVLLFSTIVGCSSRRNGPRVGREPPQRTIAVENWTASDFRIFAVYGGDLTMLGTARAMGTTTVRLPVTAPGSIRLLAMLLGAVSSDPQHISEPVHLSEGQRIKWQLRATGGSAITYQPTNSSR